MKDYYNLPEKILGNKRNSCFILCARYFSEKPVLIRDSYKNEQGELKEK